MPSPTGRNAGSALLLLSLIVLSNSAMAAVAEAKISSERNSEQPEFAYEWIGAASANDATLADPARIRVPTPRRQGGGIEPVADRWEAQPMNGVEGGTGAFGSGGVFVPVDQGDTVATAEDLAVGGFADGAIEISGDQDHFRIKTSKRTDMSIYSTGKADVVGTLLDAAERELASDDDGGHGFNFLIEATVSPGVHYVGVGGFAGKHSGPYSLAANTTVPNAVASWRNLGVAFDVKHPGAASMTVDVYAVHKDTKAVIEVNSFATAGHDVAIHGLETASGGPVMGTQQYQSTVSCGEPSESRSYDALLLFDRSGNMASVDPGGATQRAGKAFAANLGTLGHALAAQFTTDIAGGVEFITPGFTSDAESLAADIDAMAAAGGDRPLWNALAAAVGRFDWAEDSASRRALIVLSSGEDTEGGVTPIGVRDAALGGNIAVHAVNLRNAGSAALDRVAQETGGTVHATSDVDSLLAHYGTLGRVLSGGSEACKMSVDVSFAAPDELDVGFGPGVEPAPLPFAFRGTTAGGGLAEGAAMLTPPFAPGARVGSTRSNVAVYWTDIDRQGDTPSRNDCFDTEKRSNVCEESIYVSVCATEDGGCQSKVIAPDEVYKPFSGNYTYAACQWDPLWEDTYVPAVADESGNNKVYETYVERGTADRFQCLYSRLFGIGDAADDDRATVPAGSTASRVR